MRNARLFVTQLSTSVKDKFQYKVTKAVNCNVYHIGRLLSDSQISSLCQNNRYTVTIV